MGKATTGSRSRSHFRCTECGWATSKWVGRCAECQSWGAVEAVGATSSIVAGPVTAPACPILDIDVTAARSKSTGLPELDRVLGGGFIPGGVTLVAGEPGVGKSTLLLDVAARAARSGDVTLYITGEESVAQVRLRADRINAVHANLWLAAETELAAVLGHIDTVQPKLLVLDSVQTISSADVEGAAGGVSQVREVASALIRIAKERGIATVLVGHVTKDGSVAGPRLLEHLVDVVLTFDGDQHTDIRLARATKNRFGPVDDIGCFVLTDHGIDGVADPSGLFLSRHSEPVAGTCVTVTLEGRRPLLAEIQGLVPPSAATAPRRTCSGLDSSRLAMVVAVLTRRARLPLAASEIYAATVGGVSVKEPAADLAMALALASAFADRPLPGNVVAFGELGLAGEVRGVAGIERRLSEAARLGFEIAFTPPYQGPVPDGCQVHPVTTVTEALSRGLASASAR